MEQTVQIPIKKLANLLRNNWKLYALEYGGVDNWNWYDRALSEQDDDGDDWWDIQDMDDIELIKRYGYEIADNS